MFFNLRIYLLLYIKIYLIMDKEKLVLTSVKVHNNIFESFKIFCVRTKFSLQKLTDRSMFLYITNEDFRKQIHNQIDISYSGSIE